MPAAALAHAGHPAAAHPGAVQVATAAHELAAVTQARRAPRPPRRLAAYLWAVRHTRGCRYRWAGTGPCSHGYDCSGLVKAAYAHVGIWLPHSARGIETYWRVRRIARRNAHRGDIAAFGTGHVELVAHVWRHWTFGAHDPGVRVGFYHWNRYWKPTAFYRVGGANRP
jgi:cell wall-associated NlpC family hydrolase